MRGTGPVTIGEEVVYAYFTAERRAARLRLSADECDRLDLFAGRQVRLALSGREPASALVVAVVPAPPFAWVEVEFAGDVPVSRAG
jgi:hypothetical protein